MPYNEERFQQLKKSILEAKEKPGIMKPSTISAIDEIPKEEDVAFQPTPGMLPGQEQLETFQPPDVSQIVAETARETIPISVGIGAGIMTGGLGAWAGPAATGTAMAGAEAGVQLLNRAIGRPEDWGIGRRIGEMGKQFGIGLVGEKLGRMVRIPKKAKEFLRKAGPRIGAWLTSGKTPWKAIERAIERPWILPKKFTKAKTEVNLIRALASVHRVIRRELKHLGGNLGKARAKFEKFANGKRVIVLDNVYKKSQQMLAEIRPVELLKGVVEETPLNRALDLTSNLSKLGKISPKEAYRTIEQLSDAIDWKPIGDVPLANYKPIQNYLKTIRHLLTESTAETAEALMGKSGKDIANATRKYSSFITFKQMEVFPLLDSRKLAQMRSSSGVALNQITKEYMQVLDRIGAEYGRGGIVAEHIEALGKFLPQKDRHAYTNFLDKLAANAFESGTPAATEIGGIPLPRQQVEGVKSFTEMLLPKLIRTSLKAGKAIDVGTPIAEFTAKPATLFLLWASQQDKPQQAGNTIPK